jgi:hypothetical protein
VLNTQPDFQPSAGPQNPQSVLFEYLQQTHSTVLNMKQDSDHAAVDVYTGSLRRAPLDVSARLFPSYLSSRLLSSSICVPLTEDGWSLKTSRPGNSRARSFSNSAISFVSSCRKLVAMNLKAYVGAVQAERQAMKSLIPRRPQDSSRWTSNQRQYSSHQPGERRESCTFHVLHGACPLQRAQAC